MHFFDSNALRILNAIPGNRLILLPDAPTFTIVAVTDDYLKVTHTQRETLLGKGVFEAFFDNAQNQQRAEGVNLEASLRQVLHAKRLHEAADLRYDLINPQTGQLDIKIWKLFNQPVLDPAGEVSYIIHSVDDITEIVQLREAAQLAVQPQQTFLLSLSDRLRSLTDPAEIQYQAACALGEYTGANRVGYAEDLLDGQTIEVTRNYTKGVPGLEGRYRYEEYGTELMGQLKDGHTVIRSDITQDPTLTEAEKIAHARLQLGATLNKPLIKAGQLVSVLFVHFEGPHAFTEHELSLLDETAERTWEAVSRARAEEALRSSEARARSIVAQSPAATLVLRGDDFIIDQINPPMLAFIGRGEEVIGQPFLAVLPELDGQYAWQQVQRVYQDGIDFDLPEVLVPHVRNGVLQDFYYNVAYRPLQEGGQITGMIQVAIDVTQQVVNRTKLEESEARFRTLAEQAPIFVFESDVDATVVYWNQRWREFVGQTQEEALGRDGWPKVMHPDDYNRLLTTYIWATTAKESYEIDVRVRRWDGVYRTVLFTGKPRYTAEGSFNGYIGNGIDISTQVENQLAIAESETKLRAILDNARAAIGVYVGPDMIIENHNQVFIDILGKGPGIAGKPLREVLPELETEGQPFLAILDEVYTTGIAYTTSGTLVKIFRRGELTNNYYNFSYTPVFDPAGNPYEIVVVAIDVTEQIRVRHALEEKEATLQGAIGLADMGTWEVDMHSGLTTYSERLKELFEFSQDSIGQDQLYNSILEVDRTRLIEAVSRAATPELGGMLDEEYTVITQRTGRHRIVRAQAQMYFDEAGRPQKMVGSMRDVTQERQTQAALEELVEQRTGELATANEELAANNEEVEEANRLLARSNDNLQKFAYVASHDLQEPLRKIQAFGDLLKSSYSTSSGEELIYLERMQSAASRMSKLIRDLLDFSRLATQRDTSSTVSLQNVMEQVLTTLELVIAETAAEVTVAALPTIQGDELQLTQLFQNLISNALKFRRPSVIPQIRISAQTLNVSELPDTVKPVQATSSYYRIEVADNGVGFDEKYKDRIFEVFQRLHGKNEFAGTGIGLAICERVVANHGGAITAQSQPGLGATFSVYLPV
ncbi:PAS domain S-box protein [Fibrella forsythiae]|uniref:histidine kinase n=1 Tax=Fibrella forsythiae TaxID=2817061 RepID=A0ABS3JK36_9BACT|nr:PAS domain S-box protein [Fibrella forsythiae]MBO0950361.1 PAS domain S-box protein [Fibrella forsythiae]